MHLVGCTWKYVRDARSHERQKNNLVLLFCHLCQFHSRYRTHSWHTHTHSVCTHFTRWNGQVNCPIFMVKINFFWLNLWRLGFHKVIYRGNAPHKYKISPKQKWKCMLTAPLLRYFLKMVVCCVQCPWNVVYLEISKYTGIAQADRLSDSECSCQNINTNTWAADKSFFF